MKYDTILYVENDIVNEEDSRMMPHSNNTPSIIKGFNGYVNWDDPKLYNNTSYGNSIRTQLNGMGTGFTSKVTDFGKWVTVEVTHSNVVTGRSSSKIFLIVFQQKGDGIILNTSNKYRSISGISQAVSYIRAASNALISNTQSKL